MVKKILFIFFIGCSSLIVGCSGDVSDEGEGPTIEGVEFRNPTEIEKKAFDLAADYFASDESKSATDSEKMDALLNIPNIVMASCSDHSCFIEFSTGETMDFLLGY